MSNCVGAILRIEDVMNENATVLQGVTARKIAPGPQALRAEILNKLTYSVGKDPASARDHDWLTAAILVLRDGVVDGWMQSIREAERSGRTRDYYLSL